MRNATLSNITKRQQMRMPMNMIGLLLLNIALLAFCFYYVGNTYVKYKHVMASKRQQQYGHLSDLQHQYAGCMQTVSHLDALTHTASQQRQMADQRLECATNAFAFSAGLDLAASYFHMDNTLKMEKTVIDKSAMQTSDKAQHILLVMTNDVLARLDQQVTRPVS